MKLVLASTSKYRKAQLDQLGLDFTQASPKFDEEEFKKKQKLAPRDLAKQLSMEKGKSLIHDFPDSWILSGDQIGYCENKVLEKPGNEKNAIAQLQFLRGKSHTLSTHITVQNREQQYHLEVTAELTMRILSDDEITEYIKKDSPLDCCGSYKFESLGISLFQKVECSDWSSITGVPLIALSNLLRDKNLFVYKGIGKS